MPDPQHDYLRRLPKEFYRGRAVVLWSMTIANRRTGWLTDSSHQHFREPSSTSNIANRYSAPPTF